MFNPTPASPRGLTPRLRTMPSFKAPRGTRDLLPAERATWTRLERTGRRPRRALRLPRDRDPALRAEPRSSSAASATSPISSRRSSSASRRAPTEAESWALRPEPTAGIVRAYVQHGMQTLPQPVKLTLIGPMFRYDRPQAGRYRQFWQFDVEAIGDPGPAVDAELIELGLRFYRDVGLDGVEVLLNSIGDAACRPAYIAELTDVLPRTMSTGSRRSSATGSSGTRSACSTRRNHAMQALNALAPKITDRLCDACARTSRTSGRTSTRWALPTGSSPTLVRGLDYYTRTAFEFYRRGAEGPAAGARRGRPLRRARRAARRQADARHRLRDRARPGRARARVERGRDRSRTATRWPSSSAPTRTPPWTGCGSRRSFARRASPLARTWAGASWASSSRPRPRSTPTSR